MSTVTHDDMPHPVPPIAFLRYKENWFFLIFDQKNDIYGATHIVAEPGFDRISFACHLMVKGELFQYGNTIPFPADFAFSPTLGDGKFNFHFVKAHEKINFSLNDDNVNLKISYLKRAPLFNFEEYDHANPQAVKLREISGMGAPQQYVHQQQGLYTKGQIKMKNGSHKGKTFKIDGLGYRDHSRSVRCDNFTLKHFWTGLHFPNHVFGAMSVTGILRPTEPADCGYVWDKKGGLRSLRKVDISGSGKGPGGIPAKVTWKLTDIHDEPFTIVAELKNRRGHVPLQTEKPGAAPFIYDIVENFVQLTLKETGETGFGLVEVGWSTPKK